MAYTTTYTYSYYRASLSVVAIVFITLGVITVLSVVLGIVGCIWISMQLLLFNPSLVVLTTDFISTGKRRQRAAAAAAEQQKMFMAQTQGAYPYPPVQQDMTGGQYPQYPQQPTGVTGTPYYPQQAYPQNPQQGYPVQNVPPYPAHLDGSNNTA
ncbi:hypothetical protein BJ165DRAFT_858546 [Panaeolus papilionaceus]|nr:hypothetical protein BJ165DRAFT_858546 [Panaeolus papilionaceus]